MAKQSHLRYTKGPHPKDDVASLGRYVAEELAKTEAALGFFIENPLPISHVAPSKLPQEEILFAFADGTNWNPGGGRGLYYHDPSIPAWKKVTVT